MIGEQERQEGRTGKKFNSFVDNEMVEDYSLRYAPRSFRKWSEYAVATAALGGIAYLVDFAIGGSLVVTYGFSSALWAILLAAATIFLTGIPISYYSAKYNIEDMDLLTRGAGFGYLGSTITSLIYASFTFIFFSLEAVVMAQAITLLTGVPIWVSYVISALMVIPLVVFGMTLLSKFQMWTQPIWFVLIALPFIAILVQDPGAYSEWTGYGGEEGTGAAFNFLSFGLAAGVALSLIAQIGEQVDYLRFMPEKTAERKGGPGVTRSELLVINKTDLAPLVGADLSVMERDAGALRGEAPTLFASVLHGAGMEEVVEWVRRAVEHRNWVPATSNIRGTHDHHEHPHRH